eukprot:TRINITY_DN7435_c0_g1_i1.p1 TRINITY_DN7435_c0_g1~~TRINITY_DN7435_c0_g1_i1.p1  ORF type:complete len:218 (-),score=70.51 TRINITY_DN7435_c0_g1_i1:19-672(-)
MSASEAYAAGLVLPREEAMARAGKLDEFMMLEEGAQLDDFDSITSGLDAEEVRFLEGQDEIAYEQDLKRRFEIQEYMKDVANSVVKQGELSATEEFFLKQQKAIAQRKREEILKKQSKRRRRPFLKVIPVKRGREGSGEGDDSGDVVGGQSSKKIKLSSDVIIHATPTTSSTPSSGLKGNGDGDDGDGDGVDKEVVTVKDGDNEITLAGGGGGLVGY